MPCSMPYNGKLAQAAQAASSSAESQIRHTPGAMGATTTLRFSSPVLPAGPYAATGSATFFRCLLCAAHPLKNGSWRRLMGLGI